VIVNAGWLAGWLAVETIFWLAECVDDLVYWAVGTGGVGY
jgi:hypothetical protein